VGLKPVARFLEPNEGVTAVINIYAPTASDDLSAVELQLYNMIMDYRVQNGLPLIPLSKALTTTAGRHAIDTYENIWAAGKTFPAGANMHSWSDAPYPADHSQGHVMWDAPERLGTGYTSNGYEISAGGYADVTAALAGWKISKGHNDVILNKDNWAGRTWTSIGIGVEQGPAGKIYHVWFGDAQDPTGAPRIVGGATTDNFVGSQFDDTFFGMGGNDTIDGRGGASDTVVFSGKQSDYKIVVTGNTATLEDLRAGSPDGLDTVTNVESVRFSDKTVAYSSLVNQIPVVNTAPVATVNDKSLATNQSAGISGWVAYSDADGDAAVQYQIVDNGTAANSAALIGPSGAAVAAGTTLTVTAAQLASVAVRGGSAAGSDAMQIRAFDGKEWGAWDNFTVTTTAPVVVNTAPVATVSDKSLSTNQAATIASWVSYSDANGDAAVQYQILDNGTAANSAALIDPNGAVVAAGTTLTLTAAQLASVQVRGGGVAGSDTMQIRAFDGKDWGAWDSFTVTTTAPVVANRAPVATINDKSVKINEWAQIKNLLAYTDADGNPAVRYEFWDGQAKTTSGYFWTPDNARHAAGTAFSVEAADLANVWMRGGTAAGAETMYVRAFDGTSWSAWDPFKVTTLANTAPIVAINDKSMKTNQWVKISDIITFSDKDGDAAVKYEFVDRYDNAGSTSGYLWTPDNAHHAANEVFSVNAADLANVWVRGGQSGMWETMQVRAFDGVAWSAWDSFKVTTVANAGPVSTMPDLKVSKNEWVQASDFLKATDPTGDTITQYQFVDLYNGSGSGYFYTPDNVKHAANEVFTVSAADLADVYIRGGSGAGWENMQVRAFDGESWGAWDSFKFTTLNNNAPVVGGGNVNLSANQKVAASSLFNVNDLDFGAGDKIMQYQFFDDTQGGGSFTFKNIAQVADQTFTVNTADLGKVGFSAAAGSASDLLWARAFDGDSWSDWHSLYANTL
jgi:transcription elongation GreA/GreB family factor